MSLEFRDSGIPWVGPIPAHWRVAPFFSEFEQSRVRNSELREQNLLSLSYGRIVRKNIDSTEGLLPESFETYQVVEPGTIIFRFTDLQNDQRSLRTARVTERGIITSAYIAARVTEMNPRYVEYLMRSYDTRKVFYAFGGGVRQSLRFADVARLPVLVPPLREQSTIVDYLDRETAQIDTLVATQEQLVDRLRERRAVSEAHLVWTGSLRGDLHGIWTSAPQDWQRLRNKDLLAERTELSLDGSEELLSVSHLTGVGPRSEKNVTMIQAESTVGYRIVEPGDLVINTMWAWMGALGTSSEPGIVSPAYGVYRALDATTFDPGFFDAFYRSRAYVDLMTAHSRGIWTSRLRLYPDVFLSLPVIVPPIAVQRSIAAEIRQQANEFNALIEKTERLIALARERRAALITAAVTGQIDIPATA